MNDLVLPFQVEASGLRGRLVRLGPALDTILTKHAFPEVVARALAETTTLTVLLAGMLKYDGVFTLQIKGDGPIALAVADVTSGGAIRAFAQFDPERTAAAVADAAIAPAPALFGKGHLAFTVDQGADTERYQGIVELNGKTLTDCVQHYFRRSEQIETGIVAAVDRDETGAWRSGGIMLQRLPAEGGLPGNAGEGDEDAWRRAMVLLTSVTIGELTDPRLPAPDLLHRLYHEDGTRVWDAKPLAFGCRCSRERVATMLSQLPRAEVDALRVNGRVEVTCQFCSTTHAFDEAQLAEVYAG